MQLALDTRAADQDPCPWCGGAAVRDSVCPKSLACPSCGAAPGARCRRPSGHPADVLHAERWEAAEAIDAARGVTY